MTGRRSADLYACGSIKNGSTSRGRSEKRDGRPLEPPPSPALLVGTLAAALITGAVPLSIRCGQPVAARRLRHDPENASAFVLDAYRTVFRLPRRRYRMLKQP